jgi:flagellar motility protein MotE (MotC chaperone)
MIKMARDFRLIPIVLLATICLFALKVSGLVFDGGYTLAERLQRNNPDKLNITTADSVPDYPRIVVADQNTAPERPAPKLPWAQEMFNYRDGAKSSEVTGSVAGMSPTPGAKPAMPAASGTGSSADITGSSHGGGEAKPPPDAGPPLKTSGQPPGPAKLEVGGDAFPLTPGKINSPGERAILGRLQGRRQELDNRGKELDMRENLIKAAEKRLEAKVNELKEIEARIKAASGVREKAESDRFKGIVAMYENMKPKDAARIFDKLDMRILVEVSTALKPRTMSEILAAMSSDAAQKLTVELANRADAQASPQTSDQLPKIEGTPNKS